MGENPTLNKTRINIFGREYTVRGDVSESDMQRVANLVDSKMREIAQVAPHLAEHKIAVLAALNIAENYLRLKDEWDKLEKHSIEKTQNLISLLDNELLGNI